MNKYKAVIFDMDGTVLDTKQDIAHAANHTLISLGGKPLSNEEIYKCVGYGIRSLVMQSLPSQNPEAVQKGIQFFADYYEEHCTDETAFYPGARELVVELRSRKIKCAVLTNKPHVYADLILKRLGAEDLFDFVLGAEHGYPLKPDPRTTNQVLQALQVFPENALIVGDTSVDLHAGKNVGMDCALMSEGYGTHDDLEPIRAFAVGVFGSFVELREFILARI